MSNEGELAVELSASYAHRKGDDVRVVLQLSDGAAAGNGTLLQLRAGKRQARVGTATSAARDDTGGVVLEARVPVTDLRPGVWRLGLVASADAAVSDETPVEARLLFSNRQPVALLPGPVPSTAMPAPRPAAPPQPAGADRKARAVRAASRVVNRGLSRLPDQKADRYRTLLKRAGRRIL